MLKKYLGIGIKCRTVLILFRVQMIRNQLETSRINAVRFFKHAPCQTAVAVFPISQGGPVTL
jgi:hypothetical protein